MCPRLPSTGVSVLLPAAMSSLMPPKLSVTLRYMIDGEDVVTTPCKTQNLGAECLPKVRCHYLFPCGGMQPLPDGEICSLLLAVDG